MTKEYQKEYYEKNKVEILKKQREDYKNKEKIKKPREKNRHIGNKNPNWKGGKINERGYVRIYSPKHPNSVKNYVYEHRLVMEKHLGRKLKKSEVVHHINEDTKNNKISNLMLFPNHKAHQTFHRSRIE